MPGIDRNRIVGKDQDELDELVCGICFDIFDDPIVTQCCRQTYCTLCMNQWLADNNTCPLCIQTLDNTRLLPSQRAFINLLNKLKIKCSNNGCEVVATMEEIKGHEENCGHSCSSCRNFKQTIKQKEVQFKTLQLKLKNVDTNGEEVISDARQFVNNYVIEETNLDERDLHFLIVNSVNAINSSDDFISLADDICAKMNERNGAWTIIAECNVDVSKVGFTVASDIFAIIDFGHLTIHAYQHLDN